LLQIESDPDYDLAASLGSRPQLRGSPRPKAPSEQQLAEQVEEAREVAMAQLDLVGGRQLGFVGGG
jgi:hypothetical protein